MAPWFWWAATNRTPNRFKFYRVIIALLADAEFGKFLHQVNPQNTYDEHFIVYNSQNKIGGLCGLSDIDTTNKKNAEVWGLAFRGNTETVAGLKLLQDYCINNLHLNSLYARVESTNLASQRFIERNGYDTKQFYEHAKITTSKHADIYIYTIGLCK